MKLKAVKKTVAPALALTVLVQSPLSAVYAATEAPKSTKMEDLKIAVLSDPHYYPESYVEDNTSEAYQNYMAKELYLLEESGGIFKAALEKVAADQPDLLLIPGDLTKNNEKLGYQELNTILTEFEEQTGIDVFIATGNHDVNTGGFKFVDDKKVELTDEELATVSEYYKLMKDFGYDESAHNTKFFSSTSTKDEDGLSYVSEPIEGYVILSLNSNTYEYDETGEATGQGTPGFSKELLDWAIIQIKEAEKAGKTVIAMSHHGILPHSTASTLSSSAMIANWEDTATALADAGLRYVFTGHMHENDIAEFTTPSGNTIYDIETGATGGLGSPVRTVTIDKTINAKNQVKETVEVSSKSVKSATVKGEKIEDLQQYIYDFIFKDSQYLQIQLGGVLDGLAETLANISLEDLIYGKEEAVQYGLSKKLTEAFFAELDGDKVVTEEGDKLTLDFIEGKGLKVTSKDRSVNEMVPYASLDEFLRDIVVQFDDKVFNKEFMDQEFDKILDGILNIEVYKADTPEKKVLQDVINLFLIDHFYGAEDLSGWPEEVLNELRNGGLVRGIIDDLLENILGLLDSAAGEVKADFRKLDASIGGLINMALGGFGKIPTLQQVVEKLAKKDLSDIIKEPIDGYLDDYVTESFEKQFGTKIADLIYGLAGDDSQDDAIDGESRTLVYEGAPIPQAPTVENGLLPHSIAVTFGEDETKEKAFSWYTGKNVPTNEIQYVKVADAVKDGEGNVDFSKATTVAAQSEIVKRSFPTVDLGLIAITKDKEVARHQIVLEGLQPGEEYYYRVGNAQNGIYSEVGTFETAEVNDKSFTFLSMGDTQAMLEEEYDSWGRIVEIAGKRFPDAKFMTHAGDMVDNGKNELQWQWFLNQDEVKNTTLVTATGNHEDGAAHSQVNHFNIDDMPAQDTNTGAFYKVDYGNTLVITLNTSNLESDKLSQEQVNWLKKTANGSDATWKIINLHKSTYSNGSHYTDADVVAIREQLDSIVTELGIDLVIGGHDHTYARSEFLVNGEQELDLEKIEIENNGVNYETAVTPEGTMYVTVGSTGPKFYNPKDTGLPIAYAPNVQTQMYTAFTVEGNTLYYNAYTVDLKSGTDKLLDSYAITKDVEAPVVSGVEQGGSYFIDRVIQATDDSGVKEIIVNGKKVENGYVLEASTTGGDYEVIVTDKAGNKTTVSFNMKGLPTVDDIQFNEDGRGKIDQIKTEFNAVKAQLSSERAAEIQALIDALESRYAALQTIMDLTESVAALPAVKDVKPEHVNDIKVVAQTFHALTEEAKVLLISQIGEEAFATMGEHLAALEEAIKTPILIDESKNVGVIHTKENGHFEIDTEVVVAQTNGDNRQFTVKLMQNGVEVQPNEEVYVVIELDEVGYNQDEKLYLLSPDGLTTTELPVTVENNRLSFPTRTLGEFRVGTVVEKQGLEDLITLAEEVNKEAYTEESVQVFAEALVQAKSILEKNDATQAEVDAAIQALQTAMDNLVQNEVGVVVNKSDLQELVSKVVEFDTKGYTAETVKIFTNALAQAQAILEKADATQEEVDAATEALTEAFEGLVEKPTTGTGNGNNNGNSSGTGSDSGNGSNTGNGTGTGTGTDSGEEDKSDSKNPDTSDNSNIFMYMMAALSSFAAFIALKMKRKEQ